MPMKRLLYAGIDLGGTNIQIGVVDLSKPASPEIVGRSKKKTLADQGMEKVLGRLIDGVRTACAQAGVEVADLEGLGIGAPSPVNPANGIVLEAVNLRWNDVPLADLLSERLTEGAGEGRGAKIPVVVDNDVNVAVYGEWRCGAGKGVSDLLGIWLGTGVGGGLIINDALYHGSQFTAGEIGHITLFPGAPVGLRSFEQCCSRTAVARRLEALVRSNHKSSLTEISGGKLHAIKSKMIAKAYSDGDKLTRAVVDDVAHLVGVAAASTVTLLGLPRVILGGGLTEAMGETFVEKVRQSTRANVFPARLRGVEVEASKLMDDAGVVGSALLAMERGAKK
ncbi:MAG: ROK family protein [Phycisphaerales bacterium]|nr:ROK family protein [Phycisphaerales bacterium]